MNITVTTAVDTETAEMAVTMKTSPSSTTESEIWV